jgi:hypothetical protein
MNENKKGEYLRILKDMSTQKDVAGGIANRMFSDLRRKFPWHFLLFSWKYKSEKVIEVHKQLLLDQYKSKIDILLRCQLTQQDVDDLEFVNESLERICKNKKPITNYPPSLQHGFPENKPVGEILIEYYKIDLKNHNLTTLLDELEKRYSRARNQLQPTYAQYSSVKLLNNYKYIKNQILNLDCWSEDELLQNKDRQMFRKK